MFAAEDERKGCGSLQAQRVTFDFARKTMSIRPSRGWALDRDPNTIAVTARSHHSLDARDDDVRRL
jgi:hypothetical protein